MNHEAFFFLGGGGGIGPGFINQVPTLAATPPTVIINKLVVIVLVVASITITFKLHVPIIIIIIIMPMFSASS